MYCSRDVVFDELDFCPNICFAEDLKSKGTTDLGQGFSTEDVFGDLDLIDSMTNSVLPPNPRVIPAPLKNPQSRSDPITTQDPELDTQSLNEAILSPTVIQSLADGFSDESLALDKGNEVEDNSHAN